MFTVSTVGLAATKDILIDFLASSAQSHTQLNNAIVNSSCHDTKIIPNSKETNKIFAYKHASSFINK